MAIETHKDPKTRKEYTLVTGKVEGVYINPLKTIKTYAGPNGDWTPTHNVNIVVDKVRISLGLTDKDSSVRAKDVNDEYQDITKGAEVSVVVEENGEYKGVTQYQSRNSQVTILEVAPQASEAPAQGSRPAFTGKKDMSGISTGHAINGAMNFLDNSYEDISEVVETAKAVHDVTEKVKATYKKANPDLSDYDAGAAVGNAILNACKVVADVKDIEEFANQFLSEVVPEVSTYVKSSNTKDEPKKEEKPAKPARKTPVKKAAVKKEEAEAAKEAETVQESENPAPSLEDDDDIPF